MLTPNNEDEIVMVEHLIETAAGGDWQMLFPIEEECIDGRFARANPDGVYRVTIERAGRSRIEQFRVVRHRLQRVG